MEEDGLWWRVVEPAWSPEFAEPEHGLDQDPYDRAYADPTWDRVEAGCCTSRRQAEDAAARAIAQL